MQTEPTIPEMRQPAPSDSASAPTPLAYRRAEQLAETPDNCYRCGYPLLGIADDGRPTACRASGE